MAIEGICDICGKEGEVFCAGETYVCAECAEAYFFWCTRCDGLYPKEDAIVYYMKDGSSEITEDDIDHIYNPEDDEEEE